MLSVFRESESLGAFKALLTATRNTLEPNVVLSGDLSYSFEPLPAVFDHWKEEFMNHMKPPIVFQNWAVIFCHSDNFGRDVGQSVNIIDGKVHIKDINGRPVAFFICSGHGFYWLVYILKLYNLKHNDGYRKTST